MIRNTSILLISLLPLFAAAQEAELENSREPQAREKIRAAHAAYISQRIELTANEAEKFWPVYREYGEKRRDLRVRMREARRSERNEEDIIKLDLKLKQDELDLEREYTEKLGKIIPAQKLVKLRQAEVDFRRLLLNQIQERRRPRR